MTKQKFKIQPPDWGYWGKRRHTSLAQAVALSCNVCPDWLIGALNHEPWNTAAKEADSYLSPRLTICIDRIAEIDGWGALLPSRRDKANFEISLDSFGTWARTVWNDIPDEFPPLESEAVVDDAAIDQPRNGVTGREQLPTMQGLTKAEMLANDWPVPPALNLPRLLSDVPKWLEPARLARGAPGKNSSALWSPSIFAVCLFSEKAVSKSALSRYISRYMPEWADDWETLSEGL